jgi:hypothetical protein
MAGNDKTQVRFGQRTWRALLSEHPESAVQFSSSVTLGYAFQHSVISADGQINASMTRQPLKCDREMHCLHFSNVAVGWWQEENVWLFGLRIHFAQTFPSPGCW